MLQGSSGNNVEEHLVGEGLGIGLPRGGPPEYNLESQEDGKEEKLQEH